VGVGLPPVGGAPFESPPPHAVSIAKETNAIEVQVRMIFDPKIIPVE
tara:strand:- start:229 stop:369 length:141 start_codon:yes stop_codon:yes gene_type:complete